MFKTKTMDTPNFGSGSSSYNTKTKTLIVQCDLCASKQKVKIDPESERINCSVCKNIAYFEVVKEVK